MRGMRIHELTTPAALVDGGTAPVEPRLMSAEIAWSEAASTRKGA